MTNRRQLILTDIDEIMREQVKGFEDDIETNNFNDEEYDAYLEQMAEASRRAGLRETPSSLIPSVSVLLDMQKDDCLIDLWANAFNAVGATKTPSGRASYIAIDKYRDPYGAVFYNDEGTEEQFVSNGYFISNSTDNEPTFTYYLDDPFNLKRNPYSYTIGKTVKVFAQSQLGQTVKELLDEYPNAEDVIREVFGTTRAVSEWYYVACAISLLRKNGKACCLVSGRALWGEKSIEVRRALINMGLVEAVVLLPQEPFCEKNQNASFILLSYGNNKTCFIDMTAYDLSPQDDGEQFADAIKIALEAPINDKAVSVSYETIKKCGYTFDPRFYYQEGLFGSYVFLGYLKDSKRGITPKLIAELKAPANISAKDILRNRAVFISLRDYRHGEIFTLEQIAGKFDFYTITDKEASAKKYRLVQGPRLIISRVGVPFKVALLNKNLEKDEWDNDVFYHAVLSDNLISAAIPCEINPVYALAFFRSVRGQEVLKNAAHQGAQLQLSAKNLETLSIPVPSPEKQLEIVRKYRELCNEEEKCLEDLNHIDNSLTFIMGVE